ncbi:hypothetical protein KW805_01730 [Candidatus Pacearchaeota archaeon]|nr:hypothetical protein [Candidatus Pacearchaeota archaeon]
MHERKGQAAMEFLMTYGWAILAAIIAIGVLAYFGVFSPGKYTTGSTVVNPPFYANAWNVKGNGINIEIKNNGGELYNITSLSITPDIGSCTANDTQILIDAGDAVERHIPCSGLPAVGSSVKGDISISYHKSGSTIDLTSTGTIAEKVTA